MAKKGILDRLKDGVVLGDGGYLLDLVKRGCVQAGPFTPEVVLRRPEAVKELHTEFKAAGAEVLQALTFYASRDKLATVGLEGKLEEMNRQAVRRAREVAGDDCLVAGNVSLTWKYEEGRREGRGADLRRQPAVQVEEGVDLSSARPYMPGEAPIAVACGKDRLPTMVTVCFENQDVTSDGKTAAECAKALVDAGADIVGINCLRNPEHTLPLMEQMRKAVSVPLACQPVAYRTPKDKPDFTSLPEFPFELDVLQLSRKEMAAYARRAKDMGIGYIGSCCGSVATHVREMAQALGKQSAEARPWRVDYSKPMSAYEYYKH
jgi:betaine-homocysteine S-methyltransferase